MSLDSPLVENNLVIARDSGQGTRKIWESISVMITKPAYGGDSLRNSVRSPQSTVFIRIPESDSDHFIRLSVRFTMTVSSILVLRPALTDDTILSARPKVLKTSSVRHYDNGQDTDTEYGDELSQGRGLMQRTCSPSACPVNILTKRPAIGQFTV